MSNFFILIFLCLLVSCSDSNPVLVEIDGKEYHRNYIHDQIKKANREVNEKEIKNYIDNVLVASHLFYLAAKKDSTLIENLKENKQAIQDKVNFERIMNDSVVSKSTSNEETKLLTDLNKYEYNVQIFLFKTDKLIQPTKENIKRFESAEFVSDIMSEFPNTKSYERTNVLFSEEQYQSVKELIFLNKTYHVMLSYGNITGVIKRISKKEASKKVDLTKNKFVSIHKNFLKNKLLNSMFFQMDISYKNEFINKILNKESFTSDLSYAMMNEKLLNELDSVDLKKIYNPKIKNSRRVVSTIIYPKLVREYLSYISTKYPNDVKNYMNKVKNAEKEFLISKYNKRYIQDEFPFTVDNSEKLFDVHYQNLNDEVKRKFKGRKLSLVMDFLRQKNNEYHLNKRDSILDVLKIKYKDTYKVD